MAQNTRFKQGDAKTDGAQRLAGPVPAWANRSYRALPALDVDLPSRRANRRSMRRLAAVFVVRPLVAVAGFVVAAIQGWWPVAVVLTWLIYGSALTAVHHLIHGSLGLSPRARRFWMSALGALVVESAHALQVTHLAHHRAAADVPDPEGYIEYVSWTQLPLAALAFRYRLMFAGLRMAPRRRRPRIVFELSVHAAAHLASLALLPITIVPWAYLTLIHLASFTFAVLAGKGPQTNWGRAIETPLIRVHTGLGRLLFFSHDQHLEHHAAPKVPLPHLRRFRRQFDAAFARHDVLDVRMPL